MRRIGFAVLWGLPVGLALAADPVDYVNPFIGTGAPKRDSETSHVPIITSTVPSVAAPFGMTQWLPMTRLNEPGRVVYDSGDTHLLGFVGSHHPAIWMGDYGQVSLMARVGTSFIGVEQARENLRREIPDWDLERVEAQGRAAWNAQLGRVKVEGRDEDAERVFYTCLYHAHLYPRVFSEYGRYYSAFDDAVHAGDCAYNDYSLWDTFRALHPLLTLTAPERVGPMVTSLLQMYREGGWLPLWPNPGYTGMMIGSPADPVIADAWQKGLRGFDLALAYEAVRKSAMVPQAGDAEKKWPNVGPFGSGLGCNGARPETRGGLTGYMALGYVPADTCLESSSRTLEYAFEDGCDALLARAAGHADDAALFEARSKNYRNVIKDGRLWARTAAGGWIVPKVEVDITEGDAWSYLFCAMHDVPGLVSQFGGREAFIAKLDENFASHNVHGNEPQHHYPYLYDYVGQPWKTQALVREYLTTQYRNAGSGGYDGDEDCGQMSAWYVFSALGFYPVAPGSGEYAVGSPLFDEAEIVIGAPYAPARFKVVAKNQSPDNRYIRSASLNGRPLTRPFLRHADIVKGGTLVFEMGPEPNQAWGAEDGE